MIEINLSEIMLLIFDLETMNIGIVRLEITTNHFEFKPMMFQMLQTMGQFSGSTQRDPHLHLKQFWKLQATSKFQESRMMHSLKDRAKAWLNFLEPNLVN